jgi:cyclophilin family peptidyl-prolyl cis-trans isomerase
LLLFAVVGFVSLVFMAKGISMVDRRCLSVLIVVACLVGGASCAVGQYKDAEIPALQQIVNAEEARAGTAAELKVLEDGLASPSAAIRVAAVRALGRLERPLVAGAIIPLLQDASPAVREEAADALAQSQIGITSDPEMLAGTWALGKALAAEKVPAVRAVLMASIGRLHYVTAENVMATATLLAKEIAPELPHAASAEARYGAALGLESLFRQSRVKLAPNEEIIRILRAQLHDAAKPAYARTRLLTLMALVRLGGADAKTIEFALGDPDQQVRRIAAAGAGSKYTLSLLQLTPAVDPIKSDERAALIATALDDPAAMVRFDGLQAYGTYLQSVWCGPILKAVEDKGVHVRLVAIDLLGKPCREEEREAVVAKLKSEVALLPKNPVTGDGSLTWHVAAHALVSLANVDAIAAADVMPGFVASPAWQVRMYAAKAATVLKDDGALKVLARDVNANVAEAALSGLSKVKGHAADAVYIAALSRTDNQTGVAAGRALVGSKDDAALAALLKSLGAFTALQKDNTRDPRLAILRAIKSLPVKGQGEELQIYLSDFDPQVAGAAAEILTVWTGSQVSASPRVRVVRGPDMASVLKLKSSHLLITMKSGGVMELEMYPEQAPATVERMVALVRKGYFDGLTLHRWAPNFVVQGGSPGANEVVGDSPFMNDEVGLLPHRRGAVGISTRGHDTGDAQLFIDMNDNDRLNHAYTVWATVVKGMDVADTVLETDVMVSVRVIPARK